MPELLLFPAAATAEIACSSAEEERSCSASAASTLRGAGRLLEFTQRPAVATPTLPAEFTT